MFCVALMVCAFSADAALPSTAVVSKEPRCGSNCLYVAMRMLNGKVDKLSQLESSLGEPSPSGYTLSQLSDTARQFGLETLGVETTFDNLCRRSERFACIAHIDGGHFVIFQDVSGGKVSVIDPPRMYDVPLDTMRTRWKGTALLLANRPLTREENLKSPLRWPVIVLCSVLVIAVGWWFRRKRGSSR